MVDPQPAKIPEWNTGGTNRTEPLAGEKVTGWAINDQPPSSYFNWLQFYTGAGLSWLYDRLNDGVNEEDVTLAALTPDASGRGGDLILRAGTPNTSGRGGNVTLQGRDGIGVVGGQALVSAGGGDTEGAKTFVEGGSPTGTDLNGGQLVLRSGEGTGTGAGSMRLRVSESSTTGAAPNTVTDYINLNGAAGAKLATHSRYSTFDDPDATRGTIKLTPKAQPSAGTQGDAYHDSGTDQARIHDGAGHRGIDSVFSVPFTTITAVTCPPQEGAWPARFYTIPANYLTAGSVIRMRLEFERFGTYDDEPGFRVRVGPVGSHGAVGGAEIMRVTSVAKGLGNGIYGYFAIDLEAHIDSAGLSAGITCSAVAHAMDFPLSGVSDWQTNQAIMVVNSNSSMASTGGWGPVTIDTTVANEIFPTVFWHTAVSSGNMRMLYMSMDII